MLFVSRHKNYRHEIWSGEQRFVRSASGAESLVTVFPNFTAEFKPGRLTEIERQSAARQFGFSTYGQETQVLPNSVDLGDPDNPGPAAYKSQAAATAMPYAHDGILVGAVGQAGDAYTGYDPQFHMSSFNTDGDIEYGAIGARTDKEKAAAKEACEERLLTSSDFGSTFVQVSERTLPMPWPGYGDLKGDSAATIKKILEIIDAARYNAAYVLEYERVTGKREKVMAALQDTHADQQASAHELAATREALQAPVA